MVGVKWTSSSNLVVHTQAPSPHALVAALWMVPEALSSNQLVVVDIIPNTRWSYMIPSHFYTGKEPESTVFNPEAIHEELTLNSQLHPPYNEAAPKLAAEPQLIHQRPNLVSLFCI